MNNAIRKLYYLIMAICCQLTAQSMLNAEIYRIVDESGRVLYTDKAVESTGNIQQMTLSVQTYRRLYSVKSVYDGDTIILGNNQRVRLLGVNTPEIESRHRPGEPGGLAARAWLQNQVRNRQVYLEYDQEKKDKYDRQLAHVFLRDGTHLNLELIKQGLAFMSIVPPNLRYAETFSRAQQQAEKQALGIWRESGYQVRSLDQIASGGRGWQRFIGIPKQVQQKRSFTYLILNDQASVRIANDHLNLFPVLEKYLGRDVEIRGWVSRRNNRFMISVQHPSALILR
ncbi:MAG: thermonuclease family protein [Burkholderiales bacterium]|nr:thermonuclease family protein [Burkholderiales bacterium]